MKHSEIRDKIMVMDDGLKIQGNVAIVNNILSSLGRVFAEEPRGVLQYLEGSAKRWEKRRS